MSKKLKINVRLLSLIIAVISTLVFLSVSYFVNINYLNYIIFAGINFIINYISIYYVLRKWWFKDVNYVSRVLEELQKPDGDISKLENKNVVFQPIDHLKKSLFEYISFTDEELDRLRKTDEFRQEFVANVSHELKTPIFSAQGYIDTLIDGAIRDEKVSKTFLKKAAKNLENLDTLLNDLLILSQVESGNIEVKIESFDIKKMIDELFENIAVIGHESKKRLRFNKSNYEKIAVLGDKKLLYQVMQNLISNSIKYTKSGGLIEVGFNIKGGKTEIFVSDNGIGIPKQEQSRIFERFYRVEKSRSRDMGGSGLGLSIVKHILDVHNSNISIKSHKGIGTRVSFNLDSK